MHSLILPPPASTPGQSVLASFRQAPVTSADAMELGSNNMAMAKRGLVIAIRVVMLNLLFEAAVSMTPRLWSCSGRGAGLR